MNKLLSNILKIHEITSNVISFINIRTHIESLDIDRDGYKSLVDDTDTLIRVLERFSKSFVPRSRHK